MNNFIRIITTAFLLTISEISSAQSILVWQKSYGGSLFEQPFGSEPTPGGGIVMGGHSLSNDGDLTSNYGDFDYWILEVDSVGNIMWQKSYGGGLYDKARYATRNPDGTYLLYGSVLSNDSDVVGNHNVGTNDYWLLKLDPVGNIIWSKCYGGTGGEGGRSVIRCVDGNYLMAGYSWGNNGGDITDHIDKFDVWLVKVEPDSGAIIWAKSYGGTEDERVRSIYQWPNGDFVFVGNTASIDSHLTGTINHGMEDFYACRIDTGGNVIWAAQYGGPGQDRAYYCTRDVDGNILLAGNDSAVGGDVTNHYGKTDVWVMKLNYSDGSLMWQKSFGGTDDDEGYRIDPTQDGGYMIAASTASNDFDSPGVRGYSDYWFIKVDANLNIQWTRTDGGGSWDHLNDLTVNNDGSYTGIGFSSSDSNANSEVTGNHGSFDTWLVNITYCDSAAPIIPGGTVTICDGETLVLTAPLASSYLWSNGQTTSSITVSTSGSYTVEITRANGACVRTSLPTTVVVDPSPPQPVIMLSNDSLICTSPAVSYQWYYNGSAIAGETNPFLLNADSCGNYNVEITAFNGCTALSDPIFCPLTINEFTDYGLQFTVYPNPAKDKITLSVNMKAKNNLTLTFFNTSGKRMLHRNLKLPVGNSKTEISIKTLSKGFYAIELKGETGFLVRHGFVKQ